MKSRTATDQGNGQRNRVTTELSEFCDKPGNWVVLYINAYVYNIFTGPFLAMGTLENHPSLTSIISIASLLIALDPFAPIINGMKPSPLMYATSGIEQTTLKLYSYFKSDNEAKPEASSQNQPSAEPKSNILAVLSGSDHRSVEIYSLAYAFVLASTAYLAASEIENRPLIASAAVLTHLAVALDPALAYFTKKATPLMHACNSLAGLLFGPSVKEKNTPANTTQIENMPAVVAANR